MIRRVTWQTSIFPRMELLRMPGFCEAAVGGDEALEHGDDKARGIGGVLLGFTAEDFGVGDEVAVEGGREVERDLYGLVVGDGAEFQFRHLGILGMIRRSGSGLAGVIVLDSDQIIFSSIRITFGSNKVTLTLDRVRARGRG